MTKIEIVKILKYLNDNNIQLSNENINDVAEELFLEFLENSKVPSYEQFYQYFCEVCREFNLNPALYEISLKVKYEAWLNNNWKDGNNQKIKNWKLKVRQITPYLRPVYNNSINKNEYKTKSSNW